MIDFKKPGKAVAFQNLQVNLKEISQRYLATFVLGLDMGTLSAGQNLSPGMHAQTHDNPN